MANTFVKIATVSGTGSSGTLQFTGIPSTYTDLCVKVSARNTTTFYYFEVRFNGVSTNLSGRYAQGNGTAVSSGTFQPYARMNDSSSTASTFANSDIYITNYASTSANKSMSIDSVSENNATEAYQTLMAGLWSSTAAITSLELVASGGNFATNSTATLYGISKS